MTIRNLHAAFVSLLLLVPLLCWAQDRVRSPVSGSLFYSGVVVERVARYSEAERAGLAEGDVILGWTRGDARGEIQSPFDLRSVEIEQAPRGPVALTGLRDKESKVWQLGPDDWSIQARPDFTDALLSSYLEGQALASADKLSEAVEKWRSVVGTTTSSDPPWLRAWVFMHIAQAEQEVRHWEECKQAYQEAVASSAGAAPEIAAQIHRYFADAFVWRSDWMQAEEHYREAMAAQDFTNESLTRAVDLENLGALFYKRGDLPKAYDFYQQALRMREKFAPQSLGVARSLCNLGEVADYQGTLDKAEDFNRRALALGEKLAPASLTVARTIGNAGEIAFDRGDLARAEEYFRKSLAMLERLAPGGRDVAMALNRIGWVAKNRGNLAKAEDYYSRALAILESLAPENLDIADTLSALGKISLLRGDLGTAAEYFGRALSIREKLAPGSLDVAASLVALGVVDWDREDLAGAEDNYLRALRLQMKIAPGSLWVANVLNNLGVLAWQRGDLVKAEDYQVQALTIRQKQAPGSLDVAMSFGNLMQIALETGDLVKAQEFSELSYAIRQRLAPGSLDVAWSLEALGLVARERRELAGAEDYYLQAVEIRERLAPFSVDLARNLNRLGGVERERGELATAEQHYRRAFDVWEKLAPGSSNQADALDGLALIAEQRGQLDEADRFFRQALDALERQSTKLGGAENVRAGFRAKYEDFYRGYITLLLQQGKTDAAFQVLERSRARTMLEMLASAHLDIHRGADPTLLQNERSLRDNITAKTDRRIRLLAGEHTEEVAEVEKEIGSLRDQYQAVEAQMRAASPGYAALTQPESLTADQAKGLLDKDTILLEYSLGEERSYLFAVTSDSIVVHALPKRAEIELVARSIYDLLTARNRNPKNESILHRQIRWRRAGEGYEARAHQLSEMVLAPVATQIQGKRLLVVSDGALQYIPFAALPAPETASQAPVPLVVQHEIVNLPSASILALLRRQAMERKAPAKTVAVLADPVFTPRDPRVTAELGSSHSRSASALVVSSSSDDLLTRSVRDVGLELSRLPFTRREAEAIFSLAPPNQAMKVLDFNATRTVATGSELSQYRIVHFATHGLLDSRQPELSGLVLSLVEKDGRPQIGFLALEDVYNLNLPAELVVLSACETGLGKEIKGEGLIGLTRGFMYAGASRVMASLWSVNDVATAKLMGKFYQGVLRQKLTPAAALRNAQRDLWQRTRWKSPYYWAAFELQGDWN